MTPSPLRSAPTVIGLLGPGRASAGASSSPSWSSPLGFLALYALGAHFAFQGRRRIRRRRSRGSSTRRPSPGRRCSAWRCSRPSSSAPCWRSSSPSAWSAATPRRAAAAAGRAADRPHDDAAGPLRRRRVALGRLRGRRLPRRLGDHRATGDWSPDHLLGPALALALAVAIIAALSLLALGPARRHRAGHRRLHGLRRRAHRRAAGPDRQRDQLRLAAHDRPRRQLGAALRGRSTRPACTR